MWISDTETAITPAELSAVLAAATDESAAEIEQGAREIEIDPPWTVTVDDTVGHKPSNPGSTTRRVGTPSETQHCLKARD
jgi:hypothetical protein